MKKVVSALTAAAMCASMAAGVMSVFAYTSGDEVGMYLKVASEGNYTVSEDGKTITFASAADAAGATFSVAQYFDCDPANVTIQQAGGLVEVSDNLVHLAENGVDLADSATVNAETSYTTTFNGAESTFSTSAFVNCFGWVNKLKKYKSGCASIVYSHSSKYGDNVDYSGNERLGWMWTYSFDATTVEGYQESAHFLGGASDAFPLTQFDVTLDAAIVDGTYTIDLVEYGVNEYGQVPGSYFNGGNGQIVAGSLEGITIVVGDADVQPTEPTPTEPQPTEPAPTEPSDDDNQPGNDGAFKWYVADTTPDADGIVWLNVYVENDPGTGAYQFQLLVDGKNPAELGFEVADISKGDAYDRMSNFMGNPDEVMVIAANETEDQSAQHAVAGAPVVTIAMFAEGVADGIYEVTFNEVKIGDADGVSLDPVMQSGYITIGEADATEPQPTEPTPTEPQPTEPQPTEPQPTEPSGDYLYGDVNKNGKVELVDIVMLNRYLTGYGNQELDDYQMEVADCYHNGKQEGTDSIEILKFLIGLVTSLPTAAE